MNIRLFAVLSLIWLAGCTGNDSTPDGIVETGTFDAIAEGEVVNYTGTEPFWGGAAGGGIATYSTPENPDGTEFPVKRFAGNNGLGISGQLDGGAFDLMVTPGKCSDGMSDRTYPYTVTLLIGGDQREGCAWTNSQPFSGPETP